MLKMSVHMLQNGHDDLISSKVIKTGHTRQHSLINTGVTQNVK